MAASLERQLRTALEAADSEELLRLCGRLDSNIELTVGGCRRFNGLFIESNQEITQSVSHHVASKPVSLSCLKLLIDRLGPACLTCRNSARETPVHRVALEQDESWMELVKDRCGRGCLGDTTKEGWTLAHFAAANKRSNSILKWLVKEVGSDCLTVPDKYGHTAVHVAAKYQGVDSLELIKSHLGTDCFRLKNSHGRTAFHMAAENSDNSKLKWLVKEIGSDCLTVPNEGGDTAVHLAARYQCVDSLELIKRPLGADCFRLKGRDGQTAFHIAAKNSDNSKLKWLVKEVGSDCLTVPDEFGTTAVHLAAEWQSAESLQFIYDQIGAKMFGLKNNKGETPPDLVKWDRDEDRKQAKLSWISAKQRQPEAPPPPPPAGSSSRTAASARSVSAAAAAAEVPPQSRQVETAAAADPGPQPSEDSASRRTSARRSLDADFSDWDFILNPDGKKHLIGRGGFGKVFKALTDRNQTVAVKLLPLKGAAFEKLLKAVELEMQGVEVLKRISHPNILQFLKCERKAEGLYIFIELVSGHSLFELMRLQKKPFKESGVKDFTRQICSGLNFLHSRGPILHRDIKCSNIMLSNDGVIKLIDFGLAKEIANTCGLSTGNLPKGTVHFMAPELFMAEEDEKVPYSVRTDVWALGCTVFEMTAMQPPNGEASLERIITFRCRRREMPRIADGFSAELSDFYLRCVDYEPGRRPDTSELLRSKLIQNVFLR